MKKEYIITRQGKDFVLYEGLLDEAHQQGLKRITTKLLQVPSQDNGMTAICSAEVETDRGIFSGIGDANPQNVNKMILPHLIRMSETRAKARALRDAVNVGATAVEELADGDLEPQTGEPTNGRAKPDISLVGAAQERADNPPAKTWKDRANQAINRLADESGKPVDELLGMAKRELRITLATAKWGDEQYQAIVAWVGQQTGTPAGASAGVTEI